MIGKQLLQAKAKSEMTWWQIAFYLDIKQSTLVNIAYNETYKGNKQKQQLLRFIEEYTN